MRLVFAGTPDVALPALRRLAASAHEVVAVVTRPDARTGRGRRVEESPVALAAHELGIDVLKPAHPRDPEFVRQLTDLRPDCCPVVAYGALVPQHVLDVPTHGWVNLHFSVLPAWRGAAPVQRAVMAGDEVTGATVFRLVQEMDAGPVLGVVTERVRERDTSGDLLERLADHGSGLLLDALDHLEAGDLDAREQPVDGVSLAPKLTADDARVDWTHPVVAVDRRVRGCTAAPGAWTTFGGDRIGLGPVVPDPDGPPLAPGEVAAARKTVHVGCADGSVRLGDVRPPGKKHMPAADWARGLRLTGGEHLG
ncbi:methionyl-tRNA formyltransferase [Solicola sp. PLA-1-18]|uniref:methionyl-tRNA formyltransferase n=1 Tax=Solicola sp. PLA-1-18 TaxID=3380532 RepID=UPI003B784A05